MLSNICLGRDNVKLFRFRKPSAKTALGVTKAKKKVKKASGITAATKPLRASSNLKRKAKRKVGYYSTAGKVARKKKGPSFLGW